VKTPPADLQRQFELSYQVYQDLLKIQPAVEQAATAQSELKARREKATGAEVEKLDAVLKQLQAVAGGGGRRRRGQPPAENLNATRGSLMQVLNMLQEVDQAPTTQLADQVPKVHQATNSAIDEWDHFASSQLTPLGVQP
jgi:hypothetical protein